MDIIITHDLKANAFVVKNFANHPIKILSKKDLIIMKKQSGRPQDLLDIEALEKLA